MKKTSSLIIKLFAISFSFVALTSIVFVWVLPDVPHWSRSYLSFGIGPVCAALFGGYVTFQFARSFTSSINQFLLASACGLVIGTSVLLMVLFIVANVRGS